MIADNLVSGCKVNGIRFYVYESANGVCKVYKESALIGYASTRFTKDLKTGYIWDRYQVNKLIKLNSEVY